MALEVAALIVLAGFLAGAINAAAGGGTLVTFPVLIWLGVPPITANISSSVGLLSGYLGGSLAYRRELQVQKDRVIRFSAVSIAGGVLGALLLLWTSARVFDALVPFLVLGSAVLLALQPKLSKFFAARRNQGSAGEPAVPGQGAALAAQAGVFIAAIYGSYFGAGLGVLLLAVLALTLNDNLQKLNGLKSLLSLFVNFIGVIVFVTSAQVDWLIVALLAPAALLGGTVGGGLARKLPSTLLRGVVVVFATVSGVSLLLT
ncbi:MAG: sulfite exporter TauE/SafE family protein [Pontimonas sp.]|nr:sulfite exporter TauE/SafE family protein [Pontimonas sp.]